MTVTDLDPQSGASLWSFATVQFNEARWELLVDGVPVALERKPLDVLAQLLRHSGEVVTKDELLEAVWPGQIVVEAALTNAVVKLRKALGDSASAIATVARVGYRLDGPVQRRDASPIPRASRLAVGDAVPRRLNWILDVALDSSELVEVWLARHRKTGEQRVFKFSLDGSHLAALKREVTLSRVLHQSLGERPDLVRILDWDFEELPFFIESAWSGSDLMQWAESARLPGLPMQERLSLFIATCDAVAAAHSAGVLHKDLKPRNVLVDDRTGQRQVRVMDFGSGRLLDPGRLRALGITQLGFTRTADPDSLSGTPMYLAPEVLAGAQPTTRSDVYSLGVLLYQLVVGDLRRVMAPGWEDDIDDPLLRQDIAEAACGAPERRIASVDALLDRLRALEQRHDQRALQHHLDQEHAQLRARLERQRAQRPFAVAALMALLVGLATALVLWQRAELAREAAREEARTASALSSFLVSDLLGSAGPMTGDGPQTTVMQVVDKAAETVGERFADLPAVEAAVRSALAQVYDQLSAWDKSAAQFERAAALYGATDGPLSAKRLNADVLRGGVLSQMGKFDEARALLAETSQRLQASTEATVALRVQAANASGMIAAQKGDYPAAAEAFRGALAVAETDPSFDRARLLRLRQNYGFTIMRTGDTEQAAGIFRAARDELLREKGPLHPATVDARLLHAQAIMLGADAEDALELVRALAADTDGVAGLEVPHADAVTLTANSLDSLGRYQEAVPYYRKAVAARTASMGEQSPYTLGVRQSLGATLARAGEKEEAARVLEAALADASTVHDADAPALHNLRFDTAYVLLDTGDQARSSAIAADIDFQLLHQAEPERGWLGRQALLRARLVHASDPAAAKSAYEEAIGHFVDVGISDGPYYEAARSAVGAM